jgi:hypothetical protein
MNQHFKNIAVFSLLTFSAISGASACDTVINASPSLEHAVNQVQISEKDCQFLRKNHLAIHLGGRQGITASTSFAYTSVYVMDLKQHIYSLRFRDNITMTIGDTSPGESTRLYDINVREITTGFPYEVAGKEVIDLRKK